MHAPRRVLISLLCALSLLGCSDVALGAAPARDRAGLIHFARAADSSFDRFTQAPTPPQQEWMRSKYWRMRTYSPYFDSRTGWFGGAWSYRNAMAIYPNAPKPEDFYLRDAQGRKLYIWYACGGGTCTQYAGDIGSPAYRAAWIADAKGDIQKGYKGLFVDDVNMQLRISDGNGNLQWPIDPRTGSPMNEPVVAPVHGRVHGADPARDPHRRDRPQLAVVRRRRRPVHPASAQRRRPDRDRARHQRLRAARRRGRSCPCARS